MTSCTRVENKITLTKLPVIPGQKVHDPILYRKYNDELRLYTRTPEQQNSGWAKGSKQDSTDQNTQYKSSFQAIPTNNEHLL